MHDVCRVRLFQDNIGENLTYLILSEKKNGIFVAVLQDETASRSHAVGMNTEKRPIYDCMEE